MFSKSFISLGALVAFASVASSKPIPAFTKRSPSFSGYGGYGSMSNFDDFYGSSDFSGVSQTLVQDKEVVCKTIDVEIVQQRLAVIREWYKKIITEQVCEVEVQTIVHQQFVSGCDGFSDDIRRKSSRHVSYDHEVASHIVDIHDSSSECTTTDLGFTGTDVGSHAISYSGDNWNSQYSPPSVESIYGYAQQSYGYSAPSYSSEWSSSYSAPSYSYGSSYTYEAPPPSETYGYGSYSYEAPPPSYTYGSSYGGYSYEAPPPTYTSVSSYGYGSSSPDISSCSDSSCGGSSDNSTDISSDCSDSSCASGSSTDVASVASDSSAPAATDSSAAAATDSSAAAATDSSAAAATDSSASAATDSASAPAATDASAAASSAAAPAASSASA